MHVWFILAFVFAALEAVAVFQNLRRLEYIAKPAVMVCLFLWLASSTGMQVHTLWFGAAILCSLMGDIFLMFQRENLFLFGLAAFLFAHFAYITGFRDALGTVNAWSLLLLVMIAVAAGLVIRRVVDALRAKAETRLVIPAAIYGIAVSCMLYAAMSTLYDPDWKAGAALLVSLGAFLFWISDVLLAWNRFISPIRNGRLFNIIAYHLGQIGLIAGVISQFG